MPASQTFWFKNSLSSNRQWWFFKTLGIIQVSKLYNNNWVGVCIIYIYISISWEIIGFTWLTAQAASLKFRQRLREVCEKNFCCCGYKYTQLEWTGCSCRDAPSRITDLVLRSPNLHPLCGNVCMYILYILQSRLMILMFIQTEEEAACKRKKISRRKDQKVMPPRFILVTL